MGVPGPHHPTRGLGERRKLFQRGPGRSPGRKWILCIFEVRKKPPGTPFSVFLSDGGAPKTLWAREISPSPLSTGLVLPLTSKDLISPSASQTFIDTVKQKTVVYFVRTLISEFI